MRLIGICIISGIRRLDWILASGKARILASVPWPVAQDSSCMRTSTQGPRTTDHGAGEVGSVIFLSKRRQNSVRNKAKKYPIRDLTDFLLLKKKNMKKKCLSVILDYYCWYTTKVADKNSDRKCFDDRIFCQYVQKYSKTTPVVPARRDFSEKLFLFYLSYLL